MWPQAKNIWYGQPLPWVSQNAQVASKSVILPFRWMFVWCVHILLINFCLKGEIISHHKKLFLGFWSNEKCLMNCTISFSNLFEITQTVFCTVPIALAESYWRIKLIKWSYNLRKTHFGFTNMRGFREIALWNKKLWYWTPFQKNKNVLFRLIISWNTKKKKRSLMTLKLLMFQIKAWKESVNHNHAYVRHFSKQVM